MTKSTHSTITRRQALTGTAAGAAAIAVGTGPAIANDHPDAELLELERQMEALMQPMARMHEYIDECAERMRAIAPRYPETLRYSGKDHLAGLHQPTAYPGGHWCGWEIDERIAMLPDNPTAQKRLHELKAIYDEYWAARIEAAEVSGHDPAIREQDKLFDQEEAIQQRAREIEPHTFEGLAVKARMVSFTAWDLLFKEPEEDQDWDAKVCRWFIAEAMRLGGRDLLPTPWRTATEGEQS